MAPSHFKWKWKISQFTLAIKFPSLYAMKKRDCRRLRISMAREVEMVPFDDSWPGYEKPVFEM